MKSGMMQEVAAALMAKRKKKMADAPIVPAQSEPRSEEMPEKEEDPEHMLARALFKKSYSEDMHAYADGANPEQVTLEDHEIQNMEPAAPSTDSGVSDEAKMALEQRKKMRRYA